MKAGVWKLRGLRRGIKKGTCMENEDVENIYF
jgi:hypothetical protein